MATSEPRRTTKRARKTISQRTSTVERYNLRRLAQFLVENATDATDNARAPRGPQARPRF